MGESSIPGQGTKIPHAARYSQKVRDKKQNNQKNILGLTYSDMFPCHMPDRKLGGDINTTMVNKIYTGSCMLEH